MVVGACGVKNSSSVINCKTFYANTATKRKAAHSSEITKCHSLFALMVVACS